MSFLDRSSTVARPGYSKWLIPPAALAVHLSIGQVYAFSVFKTSLVAHFESSQTAIAWIFSIAIVMLGLSAAVFGTWVERVGPRKAMATAALCWGTGFVIGSLGIAMESLPVLYLGYGVIGGIGLGIGYISPVSTLLKWFPDRPGLATGMAIMGFGGGALIASPASNKLLSIYDSSFNPNDKGAVADGTALSSTFLTLGIIYVVFMLIGAALVRVPPGHAEGAESPQQPGKNGALVRASEAIRTPQFAFLWVVLFCNVTAGIGILEQAAPMIQDFFRDGGEYSVVLRGGSRLRRHPQPGQHGRPLHLVEPLRRHRSQADVHDLPRGRARALLPDGDRWAAVNGDLRGPCGGDPLLLRRRLRHRPGVPQGPVRHPPGRRHPWPVAHRLGGRRRGRPAHRQRVPGRRG